MSNRSIGNICREIKRDMKKYIKRGLKMAGIHGDGEFYHPQIEILVAPFIMHICAPNEHCEPAKRVVETIKERT